MLRAALILLILTLPLGAAAQEEGQTASYFYEGCVDFADYVAFRPDPVIEVHPDRALGITGTNLLESLEITLDRERRTLRLKASSRSASRIPAIQLPRMPGLAMQRSMPVQVKTPSRQATVTTPSSQVPEMTQSPVAQAKTSSRAAAGEMCSLSTVRIIQTWEPKRRSGKRSWHRITPASMAGVGSRARSARTIRSFRPEAKSAQGSPSTPNQPAMQTSSM